MVTARVLRPPEIRVNGEDVLMQASLNSKSHHDSYGDDTEEEQKDPHSMTPHQGVWNLSHGKKLFSVNQDLLDEWILISFGSISHEETNRFIQSLTLKAQEMGIKMLPPKRTARAQGSIEGLFQRAMSCSSNLRLIVFLVTGEEGVYNEIKLVGDVYHGIPTQCILERNAKRLHVSFLSNLILKINTKLGGTNGVIANTAESGLRTILPKKTMIVGVDVTHPDQSTVLSSVAAVVASFDQDCCRYSASVRVQSKNEVVQDFPEMVVQLLQTYQGKNKGDLPDHVIIYRDGVSGGQYSAVLEYELRGLKEACKSLKSNYSPSVTVIIVQKRHHTRFIPTEESKGVGRCNNIPPGTVVDTQCVHPTHFDFYLCSHFGVQGTSRPTHYVVIHDDNDLKADQLQKLTYNLCHVYAKCNRSISIPAAVQYAHLAAYRARVHMHAVLGSETPSNNSLPGHQQQLLKQYNDMIIVDPKLTSMMYFC
jgi:eukaryotic translation initiation factor 2C